LNIERAGIGPAKADPKLLVDADTVLTPSVPGEVLEPIARRYAEIVDPFGRVELIELPTRTWTRDMLYHPHVHILVTGGGLDRVDGRWVKSKNPAFLLPCRALSVIFRAKVRDALQAADLLGGIPRRTWRRKWVVHCRHAGTGEKVLEYLGRYVYRIAIANSRLESFDGERVVFRYRDGRSGEMKRRALDAVEFTRRFLQHVLPRHFVKVRAYGLYGASCRPALEHARQILAQATQPSGDSSRDTSAAAPAVHEEPVAVFARTCPHCKVGHMRIVAELMPMWASTSPHEIRAPP